MTVVPAATAEAVRLIEAHFAALEVGARVALERTYTEADVAEYVERTGIEYPGQHVADDGAHLLPPGMLLVGPARTFGILEGPPLARGGLFTAATRRYRRPVRLGESVRYEAALTDKFERGGYFYILVAWHAFDAEGHEVGSGVEEHTVGSARKPRAS
ncbi:MAG: hypothetical protein M0R73_05105 [Dehalococcoidia bacterium]|nr:hypothetical protein [Dehalococcoidia bacterium]